MAPLPIPAPNSQAVNTGGGVPSFITVWWNWFNSLASASGVIDGSNAPAGNVGEYLSAFRASGSAINLPITTDTQVTSLALTAGDWDLYGEAFFQPTGTLSGMRAAINTTVSSTPAAPADGVDLAAIRGVSTGQLSTLSMRTRASIASPTTYLLIAFADIGSGTCTGYGALRARRVR